MSDLMGHDRCPQHETMVCPAESVLVDFVARTVAAEPASEVEAHLADCADCRRLVFALALSGEPASGAGGHVRHRIGRFEVIGEIGAGAMGRVYRARDPGLDREVAIKVQRAQTVLASEEDERLRREGRALARLSHPNVVAVHETGHDGVTSYIVMECVEGMTLDRWVATPRPVRAVLDVLAGVGRGLAAAHGVGLVHRDVKPGNIFVTPDGTAKIGDFGLARLGPGHAAEGAAALPTGELTITLSLTGSLIGTPAYMAPEQLAGQVANERSDQFGFCVTVFEAITGERPFAGGTCAELVAAIARGPRAAALERLPRRLRAVVARGLALDPARRHPSMDAVVAALVPRAPRTRWFVVGGAVVGLAVAGALRVGLDDPAGRCATPDARVQTVFGAPRRVLITGRFAARDPRGVDEARVVGDLLAAYGERWQAAETLSCKAGGGEVSPLRDRQRACLERRLARADDLGALLEQPAWSGLLTDAARAVEALGDPSACLRIAASGAEQDPPSPGLAPLLAAYERQVDRLVNLVQARRTAEAHDVEGLVAAVRAFGAPSLLSRAQVAQAEIYAQRERFGDLEALFDEAVRAGAQAHDDVAVAEAWTARVFALRGHLGHAEETRRWLAVADSAIVRAGEPPELRARLHTVAGLLHADANEHALARRDMAAALAILERKQPTPVLALASLHNNVGLALTRAGEIAGARAEFDRSLALVRGAHGELHPDVVAALLNLGLALGTEDAPAAIRFLGEARRIAAQVQGPSSFAVAKALDLEGLARNNLGEHAAAVALHRRAYELKRAVVAPDHPTLGYSLGNLARAELALGDYRGAVRDLRDCLRILEATLGPRDTFLAVAHSNLGDALRWIGDPAGATAAYRAALAIYETGDAKGGEAAALVRVDLGYLLVLAGDLVAARDQFGRAEPALRGVEGENRGYRLRALAGLVVCDAADGRVDRTRLGALEDAVAAEPALSPETIGFTAFARARAWVALGDRARSRSLAQAARAAFARAGITARSGVPMQALAAMR